MDCKFLYTFKVGEVAILINTVNHPEYENTNVVIKKGLERDVGIDPDSMNINPGLTYQVETWDGRRLAAQRHQLKPKVAPPSVVLEIEEVT